MLCIFATFSGIFCEIENDKCIAWTDLIYRLYENISQRTMLNDPKTNVKNRKKKKKLKNVIFDRHPATQTYFFYISHRNFLVYVNMRLLTMETRFPVLHFAFCIVRSGGESINQGEWGNVTEILETIYLPS